MTRNGSLVLLLILSACARSPESQFARAQRVALDLAAKPAPSCGPTRVDAVRDGLVTIRPGETVCAAVVSQYDLPNPVGVVASDADPRPRIVLRSWRQGDDVFLTIHNPFPRHLKFRAGMLLAGEMRPRGTTSCPVVPKGFSLEHWMDPVAELVLADFRFVAEGPDLVCD